MKKWKYYALGAVLMTVAYLVGISLVNPPKPAVTASNVAHVKPNPPTRSELLALVNKERAKYGVAPLKESPILDKSAQWKATDEVNHHYFGHVKPGTTGNDGLDYLNSLHPPCSYISENIVWNVDPTTHKEMDNTAEGSVKAWIASPPHHKAMIDPRYTLTGFGIDGTQVTEHFCAP